MSKVTVFSPKFIPDEILSSIYQKVHNQRRTATMRYISESSCEIMKSVRDEVQAILSQRQKDTQVLCDKVLNFLEQNIDKLSVEELASFTKLIIKAQEANRLSDEETEAFIERLLGISLPLGPDE